MNHTGVRLTGSPRAARTRSESDAGPAAVPTTGDPPRRPAQGCGRGAEPATGHSAMPSAGSRAGLSGASVGPLPSHATYPAHVAHQRTRADDGTAPPPAQKPAEFQAALEALATVPPRAEVVVEHIPAPQRLAPWSHAVGIRVGDPADDED